MPPGFRVMRRRIICRAPRVRLAGRRAGDVGRGGRQATLAIAAGIESKVSGYLRRVKA